MQQHQHPGWSTQVVHPCDGLLPSVTALVQVDGSGAGATDPTHFVRDGAFIGVNAQPRAPSRHPVSHSMGFIGPDAGRAHTRLSQATLPVGTIAALHHHVQFDLAR
ncbi:Uncharacterised protein [Mycobacterium tuberculosis]|nr:Uncharacterised protein [Mycobacterium tuberculosis]CNM33682.1 Uncharacterised protein [Mycobacterium tuberculosis]CNM83014.1 Uncharacterised protein [Mycobacterium tuberculosis]COU96392.1 Uncharacterised protein [Mycobacterium tuberculosis]COW48014.1 Uncharacterised protein [Mycobacterium tuberculosis]